MRRPMALVAALLIGLPLAARAQWSDDERQSENDGRWNDGNWSGDDQYSDWSGPGDPRDGYAPGDGYGERDDGDPRAGYDHRDEYDHDGDYEHRGPAGERAGPSMRDFHAGLDEHGRWIDTPEYGVVWQPTRVSSGWRPYWDGRWVYTSAGWTWISDEPWGWATYHYGRWAYLDGGGWVWLPGRVWAPAWVAWRWGNGVAGWCPLGPRGVVYVQPHFWVFVESPRFLEPVRRVAVPVTDVRVYYGRARPLPVWRPGPRAGPPRRDVEIETRRTVRPMPLVDARSPITRAIPSGPVQVFRPRTEPIVRAAQPMRPIQPAQQAGPATAQPLARPAAPAQPQSAPHTWHGTVPQQMPRTGSRGDQPAVVPRAPQPQVTPRTSPERTPATAPQGQQSPHEWGGGAPRYRSASPVAPAARAVEPEFHGGAAARPAAAPRPARAAIVRIEKKQ